MVTTIEINKKNVGQDSYIKSLIQKQVNTSIIPPQLKSVLKHP